MNNFKKVSFNIKLLWFIFIVFLQIEYHLKL